ncbi:NUDIX domain-containing protein [Qipengyuania qiaonensis]|uniref:GDP-mannose pyrophosphatase n=1 Tax=Qipengyuania qiaonensis TaxID=2867240 RepID=A0ABS7JCW6_9SPHN|nr:NUDIX hydrolase [Qipengyuania qiaonensis]MBX7483795.1 NUDIX hydrolase [Qipengyuania qiaonensis]
MPHDLIESRTIFVGQFVNIRMDIVDIGTSHVDREVVEECEGVLVVPVTESGTVILVEQSRHLFGTTYEVPAGAINSGETPIEAAVRELREEAGLKARHLELLSSHVNGVHMSGRNYCFLATGLEGGTAAACDADEEFHGCAEFSFEDIAKLIDEGKIPDLRNRACLWRAQLHFLGAV